MQFQSTERFVFILVTLFSVITTIPAATQPSDSLFIDGCYKQNGTSIKRSKLENFLLDQSSECARYADQSKGLRLSAWVVGTPLWCANTGYTIYQIKQLLDAIEKQEMVSTGLTDLSVPLFIGADVTLFIQSMLQNRSDYALFRSARAYNASLLKKRYADSLLDIDRQIIKTKSGLYQQDRLLLPAGVLMPVLKEQSASRNLARWSQATGFTGSQTASIGGMFIALAVMAYLNEQAFSPTREQIHERQVQLSIGIGITGFGIINSIISDQLTKSAVRAYNSSVR
jgi:hypothetical protein